jgi:hypothetical protein
MITYATSVRRSRVALWVFLFTGTLLLALDALGAETDDENRLSLSTQSNRVDRDNGAPGITTEDRFAKLLADGRRGSDADTSFSKAELRQSGEANVEFWFYGADVELFNDHDDDGFFHGIDLWFDADTYYDFAEVYAVVYLSLDGGPWNEYVATDDFLLTGTASDDDYVIVTELVSGYPSGSYDILIELFDAYDNRFLAWIGPEDTPELAFLPLEDADRDIAAIPEVIVVHERGGGSTGGLLILILALAALVKRRHARCA